MSAADPQQAHSPGPFIGATTEIRVTAAEPGNEQQATEWIQRQGLYAMHFDVPPVDNAAHWHTFSSVLFITRGELHITDVARNVTLRAGPGDQVLVPARVLHREQSATGYRVLAGLSVAAEEMQPPIDRDPALL